MSRSFDTYLNHISQMSASTKGMFLAAHKTFPGVEGLIGSKPAEERVYDALQEWINGLKLHPTTVRSYFSAIRLYLHYRGIRLHQVDVQHTIRLPRRYVEELHPLSRNEIMGLLEGCDKRHRVLYLAQLSSGMRIGEMVQIRRRHLHADGERIMVKIPATFTKTRRGRTTFLSREVSRMFGRSLENMDGADLVFANHKDPDVAKNMEVVYMNRLVKRVGLCEKYETNGRSKITTHSFRAFFITQISQHDPNLAKMFAGQKGYLLEYDRRTDEEKLEKYMEFEPDLIIRDHEPVRRENKILKTQVSNIKELIRENEEQKFTIGDLTRRVIKLENIITTEQYKMK